MGSVGSALNSTAIEFGRNQDDSILYKGRASLSAAEISYLQQYSVMSGTPNSYLRYPDKLISLKDLDVIKNGIPAIDNVIARSTLEQDIIVYRTIDSAYFSNISVGETLQDKAYGSTSLYRDVAENIGVTKGEPILLRITVPAGRGRGIYIRDIASAKDQYEFLIKRNAKYKITNKGSGVVNVMLK